MIAMFFIAIRNRAGIEASASATWLSNCFLCTALCNDVLVVVAPLLHNALLAEWLGPADAAPVQDERVGGTRPALLRHRRAQLLLDDDGIVPFGDANPVRDAEDVPIHRQPRHAERVPEADVGR